MSISETERAVAIVEHSRSTHVDWIEHFKECPRGGPGSCPICTDDAKIAGDHEHHARCVADYDFVIAQLRACVILKLRSTTTRRSGPPTPELRGEEVTRKLGG